MMDFILTEMFLAPYILEAFLDNKHVFTPTRLQKYVCDSVLVYKSRFNKQQVLFIVTKPFKSSPI